MGHIALNCFFRFDQSFNGVSSANMESNKSTNSANTHSTYFVTQENLQNQDRYMDSGASNHVTNDSLVIEQGTKFPCTNQIIVGNGQSVNIKSKGK